MHVRRLQGDWDARMKKCCEDVSDVRALKASVKGKTPIEKKAREWGGKKEDKMIAEMNLVWFIYDGNPCYGRELLHGKNNWGKKDVALW